MKVGTIQQYINDVQYVDNTKDGVSMNERTFIAFVKSLIKEYGDRIGNNIFISLDYLPRSVQQEYLKQYFFFEGYIEDYNLIWNKPHAIDAAIEAEESSLNFWLAEYVKDVEQEYMQEYLSTNNLVMFHHKDNGEPYYAWRR